MPKFKISQYEALYRYKVTRFQNAMDELEAHLDDDTQQHLMQLARLAALDIIYDKGKSDV